MIAELIRSAATLITGAGFKRTGPGSFRCRKCIARLVDGWFIIEHAAHNLTNPFNAEGLPGPWKATPNGRGWSWLCELPISAFEPLDADSRDDALRDALQWPLALLDGKDWQWTSPPTKADLEKWIPRDRLSVQAGSIAKVIEPCADSAERLAFMCVLAGNTGDLPPANAAWLNYVLQTWQSQWRMVRVARQADATLVAEVDLTGIPPSCAEVLSLAACDALRNALPSVLPAIGLLLDRNSGVRTLTTVDHAMIWERRKIQNTRKDGKHDHGHS